MNKRTDTKMEIGPYPDADLDWLAWCFVAGDLADDQALAFQQRLESEPGVVQAVARAVELYECCESGLAVRGSIGGELGKTIFANADFSNGRVGLTGKVAAPKSGAGNWRMTVVLSLAAVALLLFSVGLRWMGDAAQRASDEEMLAAAWAEQLDGDEESRNLASMLEDDFDVRLASESGSADYPDIDGQGWVFAAAIALDGLDFDSDDDEQQVF